VNPELLRNLWLQVSPERLIAAPLILGAVFALAAFATDSWEVVGSVASWGYVLIAYLWGTRRAVNVLADEIAAGTWDGQRMSSISPWTMAWGKLLGGTAYVWYCALLCLVIYAAAEVESARGAALVLNLPLKITGALLVQAVALLLALVLVGKGRRLSRRTVAFAQGGALFVGLTGVSSVLLPSLTERFGFGAADKVTWFGFVFPSSEFTLLTQVLFLGWAVVAVYRLMAGELQVRQRPWVWLSFSLFLILYDQGLLVLGPNDALSLRFLSALLVAIPLYYLALFAQPNDIIRYRWLSYHLHQGNGRNLLALMPLWLPSLLLAAGLAIVVAVLARSDTQSLAEVERVARLWSAPIPAGTLSTAIALILFLLRDLGIVLLLSFAKRPKAPDLAAILYLIVLYGICGGLALAAGATSLLPLFWPGAGGNALVVVLAPLIQVILVAILLQRRWAAQNRALQLRPAA
jgi:hypothetical protein